MPNKKDYSNLMTNTEFFAKWTAWEPLVYRVVLSHIREFPLHTRPGCGETADVVGEIRETMQRLAIFARHNPAIQGEKKYIGCQVLSIMKHMWQDHCRINTRRSVCISTVGYDAGADEGKSRTDMAAVDNSINHDPNIDWSMGLGNADDYTSERMTIDVLSLVVESMPAARKTSLAAQALAMFRQRPVLAGAPTTAAIAAAMCLEESTATAVRDVLREAASYVRETVYA